MEPAVYFLLLCSVRVQTFPEKKHFIYFLCNLPRFTKCMNFNKKMNSKQHFLLISAISGLLFCLERKWVDGPSSRLITSDGKCFPPSFIITTRSKPILGLYLCCGQVCVGLTSSLTLTSYPSLRAAPADASHVSVAFRSPGSASTRSCGLSVHALDMRPH